MTPANANIFLLRKNYRPLTINAHLPVFKTVTYSSPSVYSLHTNEVKVFHIIVMIPIPTIATAI
jgi:hypothetical protein